MNTTSPIPHKPSRGHRRVIDQFDLRRRLALDCEVQAMRWSEIEQRWELETAHGPRTVQHVVVATGALAEPVIPDLPGLGTFKGARFHSARWDHTFDLAGKRVAAVGTGASAIQFVPAIQPTVAQMTVFQRTPPWIMPRQDHEIAARTRGLFRAMPLMQRLARAAIYLQFEWMILAFQHPWLMRLPERRARMQWTAGGCQSWYLNENGRNVNVWPGSTFDDGRSDSTPRHT
jgi:cation diffusion facilitator CzcD-associated flavoprotein CzcO